MCRELGKATLVYVWVHTYTEGGMIKQNGDKAVIEQHLAHTKPQKILAIITARAKISEPESSNNNSEKQNTGLETQRCMAILKVSKDMNGISIPKREEVTVQKKKKITSLTYINDIQI